MKPLFISISGHTMHEKIAKYMGWDFTESFKDIKKGNDFLIFEGSYIKPYLLKKIGYIKRHQKIIVLFPDPRLYRIDKDFSWLRKKMSIKCLNGIDGAICFGNFLGDLFKKYNKKTPMVVSYGFIFKDKYEKLKEINPNLLTHNLLFIGDGYDVRCKGLDILIDVFRMMKEDYPDARLDILGRRWKEKEWITEGIYFHGRVNIVPYLKKASLLLHFGRGEGFGLNIVESMLAGVPAMVSEYTGAKEVVGKVRGDFVLPLNESTITDKIASYFSLSPERKLQISKKGKIQAKSFQEEIMLKYFKKQFNKLIGEIQ